MPKRRRDVQEVVGAKRPNNEVERRRKGDRHKSKESIKCFRCGRMGHIAKDCGPRRLCASATVGRFAVEALVDTGSPLTLMSSRLCDQLRLLRSPTGGTLVALRGLQLTVDHRTTVEVEFDRVAFDIACLIVPDGAIEGDLLLGTDFLLAPSTDFSVADGKVRIGMRDVDDDETRPVEKRINFVDYRIVDDMIYPLPEKTAEALHFPTPERKEDVGRFLDLAGYFREFIGGYASLAMPLADLFKKHEPFVFGKKQRAAFDGLKTAIASGPTLRVFERGRPTELHADAGRYAYGAVLVQESPDDGRFHPIGYMSRKTTASERNYLPHELEVLAVIEALKKYRVFLVDHFVKIVTDRTAFDLTMRTRYPGVRGSRWASILEEFLYEIEQRPETRANALHRGLV